MTKVEAGYKTTINLKKLQEECVKEKLFATFVFLNFTKNGR